MNFQHVQNRIPQLVFIVSSLGLSWYGMMAVHELGHVSGALLTGGRVQQVVLHPATISRTDISPNPSPLVVVWLGPVVGCGLPLLIRLLLGRRSGLAGQLASFFAGFCLIANGAYISIGAFDGIGDCGIMLSQGSPLWVLIAFGAINLHGTMSVLKN